VGVSTSRSASPMKSNRIRRAASMTANLTRAAARLQHIRLRRGFIVTYRASAPASK
jgi:hypothetical protein